MNKKYCPLLMSALVVLVIICFVFLLLQYRDFTLDQKYNEQLDQYKEALTTYQENLDENDQAINAPIEPNKNDITVNVFDIIKYNEIVMIYSLIGIVIIILLFIASVIFCDKERLKV